jgi:hypothetical protein
MPKERVPILSQHEGPVTACTVPTYEGRVGE